MSATRIDPVGVAEWPVWTTTARIVVTDPAVLDRARTLVERELRAVDVAASRFRTDSEVSRVARSNGTPVQVSSLLAELISVALRAALRTGGAVDPTLGAQLSALGYDRNIGAIVATTSAPAHLSVRRLVSWCDVALTGNILTVPRGVLLDLGATAKAWAADHCARLIVERCGGGALVSLGGDLSVAGRPPEDGWVVLVQDGEDQPRSLIRLDGARAVATSSTLGRVWRRGDQRLHHILDPRTCRPASTRWRTVSVAGPSCVEANELTTAAIVRADTGLPMLRAAGLPARLISDDGSEYVLNGWPRP
jgi:thiamine biosynthesis lipoprotein